MSMAGLAYWLQLWPLIAPVVCLLLQRSTSTMRVSVRRDRRTGACHKEWTNWLGGLQSAKPSVSSLEACASSYCG